MEVSSDISIHGGDENLLKGEKMRTAQTASVRTQKQMDQQYLQNIAKQIAGECKITLQTVRDHGDRPDLFSKHVFQHVLQKIARMNPQTLGRILAYGLPAQGSIFDPYGDETAGRFEANGRRVTSMSETWFGTVENTVTGMMLLEWSATAVVVAAIYDHFRLELVARYFVNSVYEKDGLPPRYPDVIKSGR